MAGLPWRRLVALMTAPVMGAGPALVPVSVAAVGAAAITAASVAVASAPAKASLSGSALILSTSVNGGTSSTEAQQASALGLSVTVDTPTQWDALTQTQFAGYTVLIIGDPSTTTCSSSVPSDALSTKGTWGPAVNGNVAVLGTAPALGGATTLVKDAIAYAASGGSGTTGLYVSLNCEYSTASAGTSVPLLASVDKGGFTVTGQGANCPSDAGTVNTWLVLALAQFNGLTSSNLGPWSSPACSVQESFNAWPAGLGGLGYYTGASPATFTASDGATGQAYLLAGAPASAATAGLSPSTGGQVPAGSALGGGGNAAAPGLNQPAPGGVNSENGDFAQSNTDSSIPTFGPGLSFSRSYDAQVAQAQTQAGTPGVMGYGWTDDWATSLSSGRTVPGDIYTLDGLETNTGNGGLATLAALNGPGAVAQVGGNMYLTDTAANRIEEVPGASGTQWGISMTAGDMYTVVGNDTGASGGCSNGTAMASCELNDPQGVSVDSSGDLIIADTGNNRVLEVPIASGTNYGVTMTADDVYTIAGHASGAAGHSGDGGAANLAFLSGPTEAITQGNGAGTSLYIADANNNRVQEVFETGGTTWGQSMTANDIYTIAGNSGAASGNSGDGGAATSALLDEPESVSLSGGGDLYIADTFNNQIREVAKSSGTQWNSQSMTANDIYTVAGHANGTSGISANGTVNTSTFLNDPTGIILNNGGQMYISDGFNNRIAEIAHTSHTDFGISMTANDLYDVAGSASGAFGYSGNGAAATSALMQSITGPIVWSSTGMYVADTQNNQVRLVNGSTDVITDFAGGAGTFAQDGDGGTAVDAGLSSPLGVASDSHGDVFVADSVGNRVQEIAAYGHTQFGIAMTEGDVYTVAGSAGAYGGISGDGGLATSALLNTPDAVAVDPAGNLYIADAQNFRVQKVSASTGDISTFAGSATGVSGDSGQGGLATSALLETPYGLATDAAGDVFIADQFNNQVYEVPAASGSQYGISMTAGHIYRLAGSAAGTSGFSGDGGLATSSLLDAPSGVAVDAAGNVYIGDSDNARVQEIAATTHAQWGTAMTMNDVYTVAGNASGTSGSSGDGGPATAALLDFPAQLAIDSSGNLYIADSANSKIREVVAASGIQWSQSMTAGDIYTVAGTGVAGKTGDGGPATAAQLSLPVGIAADPIGDLFITSSDAAPGIVNNLREVTASSNPLSATSPASGATWSASGVTITQPGGSQVTFYPKNGSSCVAPYVAAGSGGYCALPQDMYANLSFSSGTYTFTPSPGSTFTYNSAGQLTSESDAAGDTLTVAYGTPLPGSGNCPLAASWCQLITAANGRTLTLGYNSSNLVTSVTDPMGRQWTYGYTGSDLTSATDPMSNKTSYAYGTGTTGPLNANDLTSVTGPNAQPGGPDAGKAATLGYNAAGQVTSETDPMGSATTYTWTGFNPSTGNGIITVADPDGNKTVYYYVQATLAAQSAWTGTTLTFEKDFVPDQTIAAGDNSAGTQLPVTFSDGDGIITTTSYDTKGNATASTSPDGVGSQLATTTQQFTSLNQADCASVAIASSTCSSSPGPSPVTHGQAITPPSSAPPQGLTWTQYDDYGNQIYTTTGVYQPGSNTASSSQTSYQLFKNDSITLNGNNITCTATPPSPSLPCATIGANGVITQLAYDSYGDLTSSSTPDGNPGNELAATTYGYDGDGEQTSVTSPDGNLTGANAGNYTTVTAYNNDGGQTSVSQGDGTGHTVTVRQTQYGYDADGNQTTADDARGYTTTTTYNADDQATLVTDPDGNATLTCYDGAGNVTQTVPPVGVAANNLTSASCPSSYPSGYGDRLASDATTYAFDIEGNRTAMTFPASAGQSGYGTTTYTYDGLGNLLTTTTSPTMNGGSNQVTVDTYNSAGALASETSGYGTSAASTISYCYDANGNQTSVVYPDGNASGVAPCETSAPWVVSSSTYPTQASYQTTYSYDSAGDLATTTTPATTAAPSGATVTATYDGAGNQLTSADPNGVTTTWTYTPQNRTATVSYSGSSAHGATYTYDAEGHVTAMTDATGSSSYVYDPFGELTSTTNGAGQVTGYGYNADGLTSSITYPLPSNTWATSSTVNYTYDNADLTLSVTDFNGNRISIADTADSLPSSLTLGSSGDLIDTTYDDADNPSLIKLKNASTTLQSFSYSDTPAGDVSTETDTPSSSLSPAAYTYDALGRATSMTPGTGSTLNYGYDASGNLTTLPTGASATSGYDKAGELTSSTLSGTTTNYAYNADGQRLTAKQGTTTITSGTWDGAGRLTAFSDTGANMTAATYDGAGMRASTTITPAGQSAITQGYVWNGDDLLMDSANAYIYGSGITPAEQVSLSNGQVTYLVSDSLGSVRGAANSSGSLTATTSYDAWGNPETTGGLTATTPFGYAGGYTDPTGLIYLINRYYDPATGQFVSLDPDVSRTAQPYAYAAGDPVTNIDPTGDNTPNWHVTWSNKSWGQFCIVIITFCVPDGQMIGAVLSRDLTVYWTAGGYSFTGSGCLWNPNYQFIFYTPHGKRELSYSGGVDNKGCEGQDENWSQWCSAAKCYLGFDNVPDYGTGDWYCVHKPHHLVEADTGYPANICGGAPNWGGRYFPDGTGVTIQLWARKNGTNKRYKIKSTGVTLHKHSHQEAP